MIDPAVAAERAARRFPDLSGREIAVLAPLIVLILVLGFFPAPVLDVINPSVEATMNEVGLPDPVGGAVRTMIYRLLRPRSRSTAPADRLRGASLPMLIILGARLRRGAGRGVPAAAPALAGAGRADARSHWSCAGLALGRATRATRPPPAITTLRRRAGGRPARRCSCGARCSRSALGSVLLIADRSVEPGGAFVASAAIARRQPVAGPRAAARRRREPGSTAPPARLRRCRPRSSRSRCSRSAA